MDPVTPWSTINMRNPSLQLIFFLPVIFYPLANAALWQAFKLPNVGKFFHVETHLVSHWWDLVIQSMPLTFLWRSCYSFILLHKDNIICLRMNERCSKLLLHWEILSILLLLSVYQSIHLAFFMNTWFHSTLTHIW